MGSNRVAETVDAVVEKPDLVGVLFEKLLNPMALEIALSSRKKCLSGWQTHAQIGFEKMGSIEK